MSTKTRPKTKDKRYLSFNLNKVIRFKLTDQGLAIHRADWEEINSLSQGGLARLGPYQTPKVDDEGYTEEQMWKVMEIYGSAMGMGLGLPFDLTVLIAAEDLKPVKRVRVRVRARAQRKSPSILSL
jgi:hypothetical protein